MESTPVVTLKPPPPSRWIVLGSLFRRRPRAPNSDHPSSPSPPASPIPQFVTNENPQSMPETPSPALPIVYPASSTFPTQTHRIRLVPHLDSRPSLRFEPITCDIKEGDPPLRLGRFVVGPNTVNGFNKLTFKSKVVSRRHAEIWLESGKFFIKDIKSSSGTFLNELRLSSAGCESRPYQLKDGDVFQLGVDYQGGLEDIHQLVKIRFEVDRVWQASTTSDLETSTFLQDEGLILSTETYFPNDLTSQITRDGNDPAASGGFADIYRGMLQVNGESVKIAIKTIKTYSGEDGDFAKKQKRLRREIKVWLSLRHLNVVPLLGTAMGFGRFPAMVCPWADNGTLTSYLEGHHGNLSVVQTLGLLNNVASGLQYLHSRSVVHGDLSGSNVLICEDGRAYIADFGLSVLLTELGGSTFATSFHARGTLRWTAPELLDLGMAEDEMEEEPPHEAPTTQSDVYSFGGVMLQILSGKVPYHYYTREAQVVHAVSKGITPRRPDNVVITERRWMFIQRCWSTVDVARTRPSSEELAEFTSEELAGATG